MKSQSTKAMKLYDDPTIACEDMTILMPHSQGTEYEKRNKIFNEQRENAREVYPC